MSFCTALSDIEAPLRSVRPWQRESRRPLRCQRCARVAPLRGAGATMNCSKAQRLPALLGAVLQELRRAGNSRTAPPGPGPGADGSLYILLSMIYYSCLGGALTLAYTRSRKLESKHDPYYPYIERD
ncbi:potassium voltage-gated channel subfamily E regulatory beta subunit 5 [Oenanthe melanoleuca]|uniref:potassium voltage-gated channel subfamily E regulatory beta subunit 5 n=1 Tax=Oenanthe melanoleuca TaxID=2939378 RepID=UPI0024C20323|nr:potassium voltage-gated channel subfamily E regulatory beta subunit 5 [Oenanthe melanoleuca]